MNAFKNQFKSAFILYFFLFAIFFLSFYFQQHMLFNRDVSWLLEASKRLFLGGDYTHNFYENNPPWILYFYLPPVLLHYYTALNLFLALQWYVLLLTGCSLLLCWPFLSKIFSEDKSLKHIFLLTLSIIFLWVPINEFGQRDHLLLILAFPYFLLIVARVEAWTVSYKSAVFIGFLAGSVFLFKPYFLLTLFLLESFLFLKKRHVTSFMRPELFTMFGLAIFYFILLFTRHQDYLFDIIPFALRWCGLGDHEPWLALIQRPLIFFCFLMLVYGLILYRYCYKTLITVLLLALLGLLFSYFVQHTTWYYHRYPAIALGILLAIFLFSAHVRFRSLFEKKTIFLLNILYFVLITLFIYQIPLFNTAQSDFPYLFYVNFIVSFILVTILLSPKSTKRQGLLTIFAIGLLYFIFIFFTKMEVNFLYSSILLVFVLSLLFPGPWQLKYTAMKYMGFSLSLFTKVILLLTTTGFLSALNYTQYKPLIDFLDQKAANEKVYFFTTEIEHVFPIVSYTHATSSSRFSHFWMLAGMIKKAQLTGKMSPDKDFLIELLSADIQKEAPRLIFVDSSRKKHKFLFYVIQEFQPLKSYFEFDYLKYFSSNQTFRKAWGSYRYLTTIKESPEFHENILKKLYPSYNPYQFDVYEHI